MPHTVAFIGLGQMGSGMARALLPRGVAVRGFDVRREALDGLPEAGGVACNSAAEAAQGATCGLVIVLTADQAEEAIFGDQGLASTLASGSVVVCMTTMAPARSRALADRAAAAGLRWLDAPVSGGTQRAAEGTLTTMVGGDEADLAAVREVLEALSEHIFHLGPVGAGSTTKMVNQMLVYCNLAATVEAVTLCRKAGADLAAVYDVICTAMGGSAVFASRVPRLIDGSFKSGGSLRIALKDLAIVEDVARELGAPIFMTGLAAQLFRATAQASLLDEDDLVIGKLMAQLADLA